MGGNETNFRVSLPVVIEPRLPARGGEYALEHCATVHRCGGGDVQASIGGAWIYKVVGGIFRTGRSPLGSSTR